MAEAAPKQFLFVSHRDINITSTQGHSLGFQKGVPLHVPRSMHAAVMEKGCLPCDERGKALDAPVATELAAAADPAKAPSAPEDQEERVAAIEGVIKQIYERNNSRDFSAGGVPSAEAITLSLGWKVDPKEVAPIWKRMKPVLIGTKV